MAYFDFLTHIKINQVKTIFELGSRDLVDAVKLLDQFTDAKIYAFECNPECVVKCNTTLQTLSDEKRNKIVFVEKAVSTTDGIVTFYPFDLTKYDNMGASSMLKIDFSMRDKNDYDYNRPNPQSETQVMGVRLDTFIDENHLETADLLCIDLQGYELNALKSLGNHLHNVKYIITECSIMSTYTDGATFQDLNDYLSQFHFKYVVSNKFGYQFPDLSLTGFSEFDALFVHESMV